MGPLASSCTAPGFSAGSSRGEVTSTSSLIPRAGSRKQSDKLWYGSSLTRLCRVPLLVSSSTSLRSDRFAPVETAPFELYLETGKDRDQDEVTDGRHPGGDPDLLMHYALLHQAGEALLGPDLHELFPEIPREWLLRRCAEELDWARENGSPSYQMLVAWRILRYLEEGLISSKVAAGEWGLGRVPIATRSRERLPSSEATPAVIRIRRTPARCSNGSPTASASLGRTKQASARPAPRKSRAIGRARVRWCYSSRCCFSAEPSPQG